MTCGPGVEGQYSETISVKVDANNISLAGKPIEGERARTRLAANGDITQQTYVSSLASQRCIYEAYLSSWFIAIEKVERGTRT